MQGTKVLPDGTVLTPIPVYDNFAQMMAKLNIGDAINSIPIQHYQPKQTDYSKLVNNNQNTSNSISIGKVILPNVEKPEQFAGDILKYSNGIVDQQLSKRRR